MITFRVNASIAASVSARPESIIDHATSATVRLTCASIDSAPSRMRADYWDIGVIDDAVACPVYESAPPD